MFHFFSKLILLKIFKWKVVGDLPKLPKCIIAVAPHTSNYDFMVGIMIRSILKEEINYVGKKELFNPLTSWFFVGLGGAPLNRKGNQNVVEGIVNLQQSRHFPISNSSRRNSETSEGMENRVLLYSKRR